MSALIAMLVWIFILILFIVIIGEVKFRYEKNKKNNQEKEENPEKIQYTLSSVFPDKETKDECMEYINKLDEQKKA